MSQVDKAALFAMSHGPTNHKEITDMIEMLTRPVPGEDFLEAERNPRDLADLLREFGRYVIDHADSIVAKSSDSTFNTAVNLSISDYSTMKDQTDVDLR